MNTLFTANILIKGGEIGCNVLNLNRNPHKLSKNSRADSHRFIEGFPVILFLKISSNSFQLLLFIT